MTSVEKRRQYVKNFLLLHPCVDCGNDDIRVKEFDHIEPEDKTMWIADAIWKMGMEDLINEMAKCEVRCSNCHSIKHYRERK